MNLDHARIVILSAAAVDFNPEEGFDQELFYSAVSAVLSSELGDDKPMFITTDWVSKAVRYVRDGEPLVEADTEWIEFLTDLYTDDTEDEEQDSDAYLTEPCSVHRSWTCTARCERRHAGAGLPPAKLALYVPAAWTEKYGSTAISAVPADPRRHHGQQEHP